MWIATMEDYMAGQSEQGRGSGKEQGGKGGGESQGFGKHQGGKGGSESQDENDLKEREYRDKEGNIHHHTRTYMEQHEGEEGGGRQERRWQQRAGGGKSEGGKSGQGRGGSGD